MSRISVSASVVLPEPGLADEPEDLAAVEIEVDAVDGAHRLRLDPPEPIARATSLAEVLRHRRAVSSVGREPGSPHEPLPGAWWPIGPRGDRDRGDDRADVRAVQDAAHVVATVDS